MIKQNTVFILGAGASKPFGYPTGWELNDEIINKFLNYYKNLLERGERTSSNFISYRSSEAQKFIEHLKRSNPDSSIDLFLSRNMQYADIGKIAIALIISRSEVTGSFRNDSYDPEQDWCSYLFSKMSETLSGPSDYTKFQDNEVKFITFNYDRSFEYLLYDRFIHDFTNILDPEGSPSAMIPFPIIHVYGVLSKLPWQEKFKFEYRRVSNPQDKNSVNEEFYDFNTIQSMANEIRIIQERTNNTDIEEAKKLISNAKRIFFLGFGYADENLKVLEIPDVLKNKNIYGTVKGLTENEIRKIFKKINFSRMLPPNKKSNTYERDNMILEVSDCRTLLRNWL